MASWIAALLFALGASTWLYNLLMKNTGSNTKASATLTVIAFIFLFVVFWSAFDLVLEMTQ